MFNSLGTCTRRCCSICCGDLYSMYQSSMSMPRCLWKYGHSCITVWHVFTLTIIREVTVCLFLLFQLLTNHYERCWKYYCLPNGWANFGITSEEELHLSRKLFWGIFESLAHKVRHECVKVRFEKGDTGMYERSDKHIDCFDRNSTQSCSRSPCSASVPLLVPFLRTM